MHFIPMDTHVMVYDDIHLGSETEGTKTKILAWFERRIWKWMETTEENQNEVLWTACMMMRTNNGQTKLEESKNNERIKR